MLRGVLLANGVLGGALLVQALFPDSGPADLVASAAVLGVPVAFYLLTRE